MRKKYSVALWVLAFAFLISFMMGIMRIRTNDITSQTVSAETVFTNADLPQRATLGDTLEIPDASIVIGEQNYVGEVLIISPNGNVSHNRIVTFEETGRYTVEFYVVVNNVKYMQKKYIIVSEDVFTTTNVLSTMTYGNPEGYENANGLVVGLSSNDVLTYNNAIEMRGKTVKDALISLYMTPIERGVSEVGTLDIIFSDMYNPENNITISSTPRSGTLYTRVSVNNGTESVGLETTSATSHATRTLILDYYEGHNYFVWKTGYGSITTYSLAGTREKMTISMDYEEGRIFATTSHNNRKQLLADLNDPQLFSQIFAGFESGKMLVSVRAKNYTASKFNFVVSEIDGKQVTQDIKKETYAPIIEVESVGAEPLPHAVVGKTYPLFGATAKAEQGNSVELSTAVYYGYYNQNRVQIPVIDGRFATNFAGTYTIEYKAIDKYGVTQTKLVDVYCKNLEGLQVSTKPAESAFTVGQTCVVPELEISSSYGAENVEVSAVAVYKADSSITYAIEDGTFLPLQSGEFTIVYTCTDFAETVKVEYNCNVQLTNKPVIFEKPALPKYYIKNATYSLPTVYGTVFTATGNKQVQCGVSIKEDGVAISNFDTNAYKVGECTEVEITYTITNEGQEAKYVKTISVVDVGYGAKLRMPAYFKNLGADVTSTVEKAKEGITFSSASEDVNVEFIREVLASELTVRLGKITNGTTLNIYITDLIDEKESVKLSYVNSGNKADIYLNDTFIAAGGSLTSAYTEISYNKALREIFYTKSASTTIESYLSGMDFNGFSSGYVYLRFETQSESAVAFDVVSICGQQFSSLSYDIVRPYYEAQTDIESQSINTNFVIPIIKFSDVLDPSITVNVSVLKPDGTYAVSLDGVKMSNLTELSREYVILLDQYGQFIVRFNVSDTNGNKLQNLGYTISVIDEVAPTIQLNDVQSTGEVGKAVSVAKVAVADNLDAEKDILVFFVVKDSEGIMKKVDGDSFIGERAGTYEVYVYVMDTSGNTTLESYKVVIS